MTNPMVKASSFSKTRVPRKASLKTANLTDTVKELIQMALSTKASFPQVKLKVMVSSTITTEDFILETGKMTLNMEIRAKKCGLMALAMKANTNMASCMAKASSFTAILRCTMVNLTKAKCPAKASLYGLKAKDTKVTGKIAECKAKAK